MSLGIDIRQKKSPELAAVLALIENKGWILEVQYNTPPGVPTLAELEYLENSGQQSITIPYKGSIHTGIRAKFRQTVSPSGSEVGNYGRVGNSLLGLTRFLNTYTQPTWAFGKYDYYYKSAPDLAFLGDIEASTNWQEDSSGCIWWNDNSSAIKKNAANEFDSFAGFSILTGKFALYWLKISEGQTIACHLIPVLDETGEACLFDRVNKQYFYNSGSGVFKWTLKSATMRMRTFAPASELPRSPIWARVINNRLEWCHYTSHTDGWQQFASIMEARETIGKDIPE